MTAQRNKIHCWQKKKNGCIGKKMETVCNYCQNSNYLFQLGGEIVKSSPEKASSVAAKRAIIMTGIIWKLFENKPENIIKLACKNSQDALTQKLHARLIALPLEVMETRNKISRKAMMLITDMKWFSWKTFWLWSCLLGFRPGNSCSPQAPPGIQHRGVLWRENRKVAWTLQHVLEWNRRMWR